MQRLCIYYIKPKPAKRWIAGDQHVRGFVRKLRGQKERLGSIEKVFLHLCRGFDLLGVNYIRNLPFRLLEPNDVVIMLGNGLDCLKGYDRPNPIIAGIGLMTHPAQWPGLFEEYPVSVYLQHSEWTMALYKKYYGDRCAVWPVGIDTQEWRPVDTEKDIDVLIYDKIMFDRATMTDNLLEPLCRYLEKRNLRIKLIRYGHYEPEEYKRLLSRSRAMVFLCEHESQGIAYQEAMAMDTPILAWDQGMWLDPNRFGWKEDRVEATSVPYFDKRCGARFSDAAMFPGSFETFWAGIGRHEFQPRAYVLENLTLEKSAAGMLAIVQKWAPPTNQVRFSQIIGSR